MIFLLFFSFIYKIKLRQHELVRKVIICEIKVFSCNYLNVFQTEINHDFYF